jgi:hypothetical protein
MQETRIRASLVQVVFHKPQPEQRDQLSKCTALCNLAKMLVVGWRSHTEDVRQKAIKGGIGFQASRRQGRKNKPI